MTRTFFKVIAFIAALVFYTSVVFAASSKHSAFEVKVTGHGQPIIFIPGATCSGDEWNETVAHLAGKYECHVITIAGYAGTAPMPSGPYLETVKNQLEQYIADNKLDNVILVGHSIGGFLSLCLASEMKGHLQKVLIVDAMPFFAGARNPAAPDTFDEVAAQKMLASYMQMNDSAMTANQKMIAEYMCADSTKWDQIAKWGAMSDKKTLAYTMEEMMTKDMRKKIADINVPVLVLAAYAKMPQYPQYTRDMVTAMYTYQYTACKTCTVHTAEDNTKHFIMYDNPKWFYSEMDTFLNTKF